MARLGHRFPSTHSLKGLGNRAKGSRARIKSGIYSYRIKTVDSLLELVQEKLACVLIAPPCTGKTALCMLAAARARQSPVYSEVYYINCGCVPVGSSFEQEFKRLYGRPFASMCSPPLSSPNSIPGSNSRQKRLIVVDEVQNVYEPSRADGLWGLIKYITSDQDPNSLWQSSSACNRYSKNINVFLTGSRGPSSVMTSFSTPLHFGADQRIPSQVWPGLSLALHGFCKYGKVGISEKVAVGLQAQRAWQTCLAIHRGRVRGNLCALL